MPRKRSREQACARETGHEAQRTPAPVSVADPSPAATLWGLKTLRASLIGLNRAWLRQSLLRLRQIVAEIETLLIHIMNNNFGTLTLVYSCKYFWQVSLNISWTTCLWTIFGDPGPGPTCGRVEHCCCYPDFPGRPWASTMPRTRLWMSLLTRWGSTPFTWQVRPSATS